MNTAKLLWRERTLAWALAKREVQARFRGSALGLGWLVIAPAVMLVVYTFVFSVVFKGRWPGVAQANHLLYALLVFSGLMIFNLFSDTVARSPGLVLENPNYVKKVVFPLEILSLVALMSSFCTFLVSFVLMLILHLVLIGPPILSWLYFPLLVVPLLLLTIGVSWLLASLGVFLRDIKQMIGLALSVLMFTSPVFYAIDSVPPFFQTLMYLNPLTIPLEESKRVLFVGDAPDWILVLPYTAACLGVATFGAWWFRRTKHAFADVI
jgi:lipopolysaccharide transport system permease protein